MEKNLNKWNILNNKPKTRGFWSDLWDTVTKYAKADGIGAVAGATSCAIGGSFDGGVGAISGAASGFVTGGIGGAVGTSVSVAMNSYKVKSEITYEEYVKILEVNKTIHESTESKRDSQTSTKK